ncbi:hypothetical protein ATP06_0238310 [Amycolatopsis regifaucium]|nr:hypothetical protein ATP06_0238310 [Amycolatopsis regifaucium]SFH00494.1 hypothetical protein SAMN04489731_10223 [Amycolatopsis regifaucium]
MNAHTLDQAWLTSWRNDINRALTSLLTTFEATYGYPPGENRIAPAGDRPSARESNSHPDPPATLTVFYRTIHEVLLPDIGNGYFVHPLDHVLNELTKQGPVCLPESTQGVVFGSDGGGILYAISQGGTIYRSRVASRDFDFAPLTPDLTDFLDQLRHATIRFIANGQPGWL